MSDVTSRIIRPNQRHEEEILILKVKVQEYPLEEPHPWNLKPPMIDKYSFTHGIFLPVRGSESKFLSHCRCGLIGNETTHGMRERERDREGAKNETL